MADTAQLPPGAARSPGPSVQEVLREEAKTQNVPAMLLQESYEFLGDEDLSTERYTSYEFHRKEVEKMWRKVWQMACREEQIPNVGDHILYEIAEHSILVVRSAEDEIKAFHNSCLHRGRMLRTMDGNVPFFRCPYHDWQWRLDGSLKKIPAEWDFPHAQKDKLCLPEAKVGRWGGWVFINMDPECEPFEEFLGVLPEHLKQWPHEHRYLAAHVAGVVDCNWKALMEAFTEGYHGPSTHPQMSFYVGDENSQYDVFGDNVSRMISMEGVPSPSLPPGVISDEDIVETMARDLSLGDVPYQEGKKPRDILADHMRTVMTQVTQLDMSGLSNTEILESTQYLLFPNFVPWAALQPMVYRFRPYKDDPNASIAEVFMVMPYDPSKPRPPAAKLTMLPGRNPDFSQAKELGVLGQIFNQDMQNVPFVQRGLQASATKRIKLANYQEIRIRHHHKTIDKYLNK